MFSLRRQRFREAMGPDAVAIFVGARMRTRSSDTDYPFRQDSDFLYLTGLDHPDAVALLRTDGGPDFTLFVQPREPSAETWTGYRPGVEGAKADYGADAAFPIAKLDEDLPGIVASAKTLYHALGRDPKLDSRLVEILDDIRRRSRTGVAPSSQIVDPRSLVHEMRLKKEPEELARMRRAAEITAAAHREAAGIAHEDRLEYELEAILNYTFRRLGATGPAYESIVGGGANATTLHYVRNDQPLRDGELVLIDAGAEFEGYASDVTRTYPVGGTFCGERLAVYEVVRTAQERALAECRPGNHLEAIHETALHALIEGMLDLGLVGGSVDEAIESGSYKAYYMHRTSHWLGLDVHDVGRYTVGSKPRPLEAGMVFTVEPGIYIPPQGSQAPATFHGIGVRIEDDVVITQNGYENLNSTIPKRPEEVEAWVRGD